MKALATVGLAWVMGTTPVGVREFTCPLSSAAKGIAGTGNAAASTPADCLVQARAVRRGSDLVDLRSPLDFAAFHAEGARNLSLPALLAMPAGKRSLVVYDASHLPQDAALLCQRLRRAGWSRAVVVTGGAAALARQARSAQAPALAKLRDDEAVALMFVEQVIVEAKGPKFGAHAALKSFLASRARRPGTTRMVLVDTGSDDGLAHSAPAQSNALVWVGDADHFWRLVEVQLAVNAKRARGPADANRCSAL